MRNMSFMKTVSQVLSESKDVTRRIGWWKLQPGTYLKAVEKGMGLKKGEQVNVLKFIKVVDVWIEPLWAINDLPDDCFREGFPELEPEGFIDMFCRGVGASKGCDRNTLVTRIEFTYVSRSEIERAGKQNVRRVAKPGKPARILTGRRDLIEQHYRSRK